MVGVACAQAGNSMILDIEPSLTCPYTVVYGKVTGANARETNGEFATTLKKQTGGLSMIEFL